MAKAKLTFIVPILLALLFTGCQTVDDAPSDHMMTTTELREQLAELPSPPGSRPMPGCAPAKQMTSILVNTFKEIPTKGGIANDGAIVILFIGEQNTWTLVRAINNISCVVDFGVNMQDVKRKNSI